MTIVNIYIAFHGKQNTKITDIKGVCGRLLWIVEKGLLDMLVRARNIEYFLLKGADLDLYIMYVYYVCIFV